MGDLGQGCAYAFVGVLLVLLFTSFFGPATASLIGVVLGAMSNLVG